MSGLYSEKTGKTYDAVVLLDDTGGKYVNFRLEFPAKKGRGNERAALTGINQTGTGGGPKASNRPLREL